MTVSTLTTRTRGGNVRGPDAGDIVENIWVTQNHQRQIIDTWIGLAFKLLQRLSRNCHNNSTIHILNLQSLASDVLARCPLYSRHYF
jgi:hypothetical protein